MKPASIAMCEIHKCLRVERVGYCVGQYYVVLRVETRNKQIIFVLFHFMDNFKNI